MIRIAGGSHQRVTFSWVLKRCDWLAVRFLIDGYPYRKEWPVACGAKPDCVCSPRTMILPQTKIRVKRGWSWNCTYRLVLTSQQAQGRHANNKYLKSKTNRVFMQINIHKPYTKYYLSPFLSIQFPSQKRISHITQDLAIYARRSYI